MQRSLIWLVCVLTVSVFVLILCKIDLAHARWKNEYAQVSQATVDWYETRTLTPEAEARFHFKSCCAKSDSVRTKFKVGGKGNDEWYWLDRGEWRKVPADIIHPDEHNPNGEATLFVLPGTSEPTCFYPPGGGI